ncbi:sirohydrochlorin chelatase [Microlunatus elymi]|uniref:sirohydrochlorin chelatase n=1 Tax=Microlunatus elymi TaxID=2596828 RepID=UPI00143CD721|nr:CbiX/SirB N-terminal domain-containing protein [Microlunatus elymi]
MPVVLLAHGSRHPQGVASIDRLRAGVEAVGLPARTAYLDLNEPDIEAAAAALKADGCGRAIVVPLLFTPAFHARTDAPAAIAAARHSTGVELIVADILGTGDELLPLLASAAEAAGIPDDGAVLLGSVGSSRAEANAAVEDLGRRLASLRGGPVRTAFATCAPRAVDALLTGPELAGVVSLFVGQGLLLDKITQAAEARGIPTTVPLETALVPLILDRYAAVGC